MKSLSLPVKRLVSRICEDLGTPRSLTVDILSRYGEWDQLASLAVDPRHYNDPMSYFRDAQATAFLKKFDALPTTIDRGLVARDLFYACERECFRSNERLSPLVHGNYFPGLHEGALNILLEARRIVSSILGPVPSILDGRFGPGATFADRGVFTTIPDKMTSAPTFTRDAWPHLLPWSGTLWAKATARLGKAPERVNGNRFTTVPKDSTKDRGIAIEPSINVFYQLAFGKVIRSRLSRIGIRLDVGQDTHRLLAREASNQGHLATLDLSNASDTICKNLVKFLLPPSWFEALDELRSKKTFIDDRWVFLEKFSSMGNGFTFELETVIFLSLCLAITGESRAGKDVFVYGDDIIIPTNSFDAVCSLLRFCGFSPNPKKSFSAGLFRESCGGDFFHGVGVRPYYLKKEPVAPEDFIGIANGINRAIDDHLGREILLKRTWLTCLAEIPLPIRNFRGPSALGDLVIHDSPSSWRTRWRNSIRSILCYAPAEYRKVRFSGFSDDVTLASAIYGLPVSSGYIVPRDGVTGYRPRWVPFS
jgi:hypothetical protein